MKFHIYKNETDFLKKMQKQFGIPLSQIIEQIEAASIFTAGQPYPKTLDCEVHVCEWDWINQGKNIIFIEDQATIDRLMNLKFKPTMAASAPLPFPSFSLAIPKGAKYKGVKLFPALIHSTTKERNLSHLVEGYLKSVSYKNLHNITFDTDKLIDLTVIIPEEIDKQETAKNIINVDNDQIQKMLQLEVDDVEGGIKVLKRYTQGLQMNSAEFEQQLVTLRLIMAVAIYNQATNGQYLRDGVPHGCGNKPKFLGMQKAEYPTFKYGSMKLEPLTKGTAKGEHVRSEHMRQLVHERYYRGEFADRPIGSRWVPVAETLVGSGKPSTQTIKK